MNDKHGFFIAKVDELAETLVERKIGVEDVVTIGLNVRSGQVEVALRTNKLAFNPACAYMAYAAHQTGLAGSASVATYIVADRRLRENTVELGLMAIELGDYLESNLDDSCFADIQLVTPSSLQQIGYGVRGNFDGPFPVVNFTACRLLPDGKGTMMFTRNNAEGSVSGRGVLYALKNDGDFRDVCEFGREVAAMDRFHKLGEGRFRTVVSYADGRFELVELYASEKRLHRTSARNEIMTDTAEDVVFDRVFTGPDGKRAYFIGTDACGARVIGTRNTSFVSDAVMNTSEVMGSRVSDARPRSSL